MAAVKALYGQDVPEKMVQLQKTRSEFEGSLTLVVFPFVKMARKSPEQTGQELGEYLIANCDAISKFNVVKGFLNLSISDEAWLSQAIHAKVPLEQMFGYVTSLRTITSGRANSTMVLSFTTI